MVAFVIRQLTQCVDVFVDASGWWRGKLNWKKGLFPSNYVEMI